MSRGHCWKAFRPHASDERATPPFLAHLHLAKDTQACTDLPRFPAFTFSSHGKRTGQEKEPIAPHAAHFFRPLEAQTLGLWQLLPIQTRFPVAPLNPGIFSETLGISHLYFYS